MTTLNAWERVQLARHAQRPTSRFYIEALFEDFIEFHGDRAFGDDAAVIGGIGRFEGRSVTVIAQEKGSSIKERVARNFGSPHPEGYRKALRLMKQAEKFRRPIVSLVDTQGAFCGMGAEERGQGEAIARNLMEMMLLRVPVIAFVLGEGGSGGALGVAVANRVYMLENAVYSVLSPEGFASILWKDAARAEEASSVMKMTAQDLLEMGVIEGIVSEPQGGAQNEPEAVLSRMREILSGDLRELGALSPEALAEQRYKRFRAMGV